MTEYTVLGVLAEGPTHGFAIAKELTADAELGRIYTVHRSLVYRALDRLVANGLAAPSQVETSEAGPNRIVHRISSRGRAVLRSWLEAPVSHVRDLRIEFLLKLTLIRRSGRSPVALIATQRLSLESTLDALDQPGPADPVDLWRQHNARTAAAYLDELETIFG
ncbi:MAG TPA: PadR family transcriptional regulator [Acidimicrobiia bacterium]|nr:PadR family transcriptional regulator [Acidimicrobiia bacterium]